MNNKIEEVKIDENLNKPKTKQNLWWKRGIFMLKYQKNIIHQTLMEFTSYIMKNKELEYIGKSNNLANRIYNSALERGSIYARYIEMKT